MKLRYFLRQIEKTKYDKRGEGGYVGVCIAIVVFVACIVLTMNVFSIIVAKSNLDVIADELIQTATYSGEFGDRFGNKDEELLEQYQSEEDSGEPYYELSYGGTDGTYVYNPTKRVQLGHEMYVTVEKEMYLMGMGQFRFPIKIGVTRSGLSEVYWKPADAAS